MQHTMNKEWFSVYGVQTFYLSQVGCRTKILSPLSRSPGEEPREYEVHLHLSWLTIVEWVAILEDKILATADVRCKGHS